MKIKYGKDTCIVCGKKELGLEVEDCPFDFEGLLICFICLDCIDGLHYYR